MKLTIIAATIVSISGCANIQQQQMQAQRDLNQRKQQEIQEANAACKSRWESDRRIDPVRHKLPVSLSDATLAQRTNAERVTDQEKPAIEAVDDVSRWCQQRIAEILSRYISAQRMVLLYRSQGETRERRANLWGGKLTYGEYLTQADEAVRKFVAEDTALTDELNQKSAFTQAQQAHTDAVRQQANSAAMTLAIQGLYLINQSSQPRLPR